MAVECPVDCVYQVKTLAQLAARVVATNAARDVECPQHVRELLDEASADEEWKQFVEKDRSCESVQGRMKIGEFGLFPHASDAPVATMFTTDLCSGARFTLKFLSLVRGQARALHPLSCTNRYLHYLKLVVANPSKRILPPPDVALVHFSHMLQSKDYREFCQRHFHNLESVAHCSSWMFETPATLQGALADTRAVWDERVSAYDVCGSWTTSPSGGFSLADKTQLTPPVCGRHAKDPRVQGGGLGFHRSLDLDDVNATAQPDVNSLEALASLPAMVADDADWFTNFVASQGGKMDVTQDDLQRFQLGYQRYLYLVAKYERRMEWIGFAPTPAIDLSMYGCFI